MLRSSETVERNAAWSILHLLNSFENHAVKNGDYIVWRLGTNAGIIITLPGMA